MNTLIERIAARKANGEPVEYFSYSQWAAMKIIHIDGDDIVRQAGGGQQWKWLESFTDERFNITIAAEEYDDSKRVKKQSPNVHVLKISYVCPNNSGRGSRVRIVSELYKQSRIVDYDDRIKGSTDNAVAWLEAHGYTIIATAEGNEKYDYVITSTFKALKGGN